MSLDKMRETLETRRRAYEDAKLAYLTALQQEQEKAMSGNGKGGLPERRRVARTDPGVRRKGGWPKGKPRGPKASAGAQSPEPGSAAPATTPTPKRSVGRPKKHRGRKPAPDHSWRRKGLVAGEQAMAKATKATEKHFAKKALAPIPTEAELDEALEIAAEGQK